MTTHRLALACADVLALYCSEHWNEETCECEECIFQKGYKANSCQMEYFLGMGGKEMQEIVKGEARARCEELCSRKA